MDDLAEQLVSKLLTPDGIWANYHCQLRQWQAYQALVNSHLIPDGLMPKMPTYDQFSTDLVSERTACKYPSLDP